MINDILEFKKIREDCSYILLIDENLCIGNSYEIINKNIISLSSSLKQFETDVSFFNENFTHFSNYSANHIEVNNNISANYNALNSLTTIISSLSTNWTRPIGIFYRTILSVPTWNANKNTYPNTTFLTWLNTNFPVSKFTKNQSIILYVTLYEEKAFNMSAGFIKTYNENCFIPSQSVQINCNGNSCPVSSGSSCNYTNSSGQKACGDPIQGCNRSASGGFSGPVSCPTTGQKVLSVTHQKICNDKHISTSFGLKYIKNSNDTSWQYVNKI